VLPPRSPHSLVPKPRSSRSGRGAGPDGRRGLVGARAGRCSGRSLHRPVRHPGPASCASRQRMGWARRLVAARACPLSVSVAASASPAHGLLQNSPVDGGPQDRVIDGGEHANPHARDRRASDGAGNSSPPVDTTRRICRELARSPMERGVADGERPRGEIPRGLVVLGAAVQRVRSAGRSDPVLGATPGWRRCDPSRCPPRRRCGRPRPSSSRGPPRHFRRAA
jgi:hypothetical protein